MTTLTTCRSIILALLASVLTGASVEAKVQPTSADTVAGNTFEAVAADTVRYTLMPAGIRAGERAVWSEAPNVRHHRMSYRGAGLESRLELDSAGLPRRIESTGVLQTGLAWEERFERRGDTATWSTPDERNTRAVAGPAYYVSPGYEAAFDLSLLAPSLLTRADRSLPLLPEGTARLEPLGRRTVEAEGRSREVRHFAVHGLDLAPEYVWLDEDGRLFADEVSIIAGWEPVFPELHAASREALIRHGRGLFGDLIPPARERPLVIQGARLFDAESRSTRQGMTIVVRGNRIAAVGPDGSVQVPAGAEVIDGTGRAVLPGLWDMHVHTTSDLDEEMEAPLYIAGGVTTVRDLGSATDVLASLRHRSDAAEAIAPRILPALIMYGPGGRVLGVSVDTPEEAHEAIDRFAALGYVQVKLRQPSVSPELVPVIAERARRHGMRLSGHVLEGMTGREAIESGYDEIQHLLYVRVGAAGIRSLAADEEIGARMAAVRPGTDEWRDFVRLLLTHDVVVDPTLAVVEESVGERPPVWLARVLRQFPPQAGRMARYNAGPPAPPPILRGHWDEIVANGLDMVRALHEAGVPLVAGTDADFGGFPLHRELEVYVEAGIPAAEVLALATLGAAHVMGLDDELGSIEPGKLADLILVDGEPTTDISDIRRVVTVIKDGRVYNPAAIYRALGIEPCCEPEPRSAAPAPGTVHETLPADTPYLWLEDLEADTVLAWAESRTERTVERLSSGPAHDSLVAEIRTARQAARIVTEPGVQPPVMRTGAYVNRFLGGRAWMRQPAEAHERGADEWQRVLDLDSLSRAEGGRLAPESVECLPPAYERCLLRLARDGRQRIVDLREFDAERKAFVADGFELREAQTSAFWRDEGSLYVTTKPMGWADRALIWRRGEPLDDARVLFTADPGDRGLKFERRGSRLLLLHARHQYDIDYYLVGEGDELAHLPVPGDVRELAFVDGRMILQLRSSWTPAAQAFPSGSLIAIGLDDFLAGDRDFDLVMASSRDLVVDEIWTTRSLVIVRALADLEIRLFEFAHRDGRWDRRQIDVPGSGRVEVRNSSHESDIYYFTHEDFLEPRTAYVRSESGEVEIGGRSRPAFSADGYEVRRYHATSADGTRVPYFVVHPEDMPRDGSTPAIVSGYGGNGVSILPRYLSFYGPWLARGRAYVLANIRGGNEYGFEWHDAVRRENRQRAFDDFQAVARDLVDRKISSPGRIGTVGGSNGGILVGTSFIQRPELYGAVLAFNGVFELHRCSQLSGDPPVGERGNGQDPDDWAYMRHYSPFHNLRDGEPYPAVLMLANRADDIVHPCHSRKFTAKLEDLGYEDVFYYETETGGHAKGYSPEEEAMIIGFFLRHLRSDP